MTALSACLLAVALIGFWVIRLFPALGGRDE